MSFQEDYTKNINPAIIHHQARCSVAISLWQMQSTLTHAKISNKGAFPKAQPTLIVCISQFIYAQRL